VEANEGSGARARDRVALVSSVSDSRGNDVSRSNEGKRSSSSLQAFDFDHYSSKVIN
jgi:hypothetical protein